MRYVNVHRFLQNIVVTYRSHRNRYVLLSFGQHSQCKQSPDCRVEARNQAAGTRSTYRVILMKLIPRLGFPRHTRRTDNSTLTTKLCCSSWEPSGQACRTSALLSTFGTSHYESASQRTTAPARPFNVALPNPPHPRPWCRRAYGIMHGPQASLTAGRRLLQRGDTQATALQDSVYVSASKLAQHHKAQYACGHRVVDHGFTMLPPLLV